MKKKFNLLKKISTKCIFLFIYFYSKFSYKRNIQFKFYFFIIVIFFLIGYYLGRVYKNINFNSKKLSHELSNFKSYTKALEDLILFCIFYDVNNGFYIDIGANDPNIGSVTKAFYLRGWNGINIEPLPNKFQRLLKSRKRDINIQIGVGKIIGNASFFGDDARASLIKENSRNNSRVITINIDTMSNICNKYIPKKEIIQFCKIDIEGEEKNALLGYDFVNYRPKVFCIESTKPGTNIPCFDQWEFILFQNDYSFVYQYKVNRYYIDNRIEGLRKRFMFVENAIKLYNQKKK